ncbi:type I restriction-modification system subunit M [Campylobacter sp. JMF_02 ED1]|uniref:type I restriction-modification system subunit M n=1 Tax=unclassified Campylobacter TaxID=2593542 RepID=UPI0022E9DB83|nr:MULTISPECIES: class I SAM-dependent DNA methyltransferase [unclassified Campylobacter]MDA3049316.1 type I restriction-modification system subunit M [Campylobacter sp. JMF_15 NE4]MDA3051259.1 type I restriction-modification system subunit M [Campylobacter sp. JMF_02 ED1]
MLIKDLKQLKDKLWESADQLRANSGLKATEYAEPVLGLIFLRFADVKYSQHEKSIQAEFDKLKGTRTERDIHEIAIEKCGFYLPQNAKYDTLLNLPENADLAQAVKNAMIEIEKYTAELEDVLPKDIYYSVNTPENPQVLANLLRNFKDIPNNVELDIFGEIYEYFLGKFALSEGQKGGEFFTPSSVVKYMVEVLNPQEGKILDPACGSGGMFVQTAHYIAKHQNKGRQINLKAYGIEKTQQTVRLAKMNLVLNNVRGEITHANSYYSDPYESYANFDFVMANPPFNVNDVVLEKVKDQKRFNEYGIPQNKSKGKKSDETVPNANYLWINLFATSLKPTGKAALVMANSASDAGNSELEIRKKLIESGVISQMVTLPSNMFSSVTLPATLWFFDKAKKNKDEILFIDARNIFTQIDRAHRKFSNEQIKNLGIITRLYEGDTQSFIDLIKEYEIARDNAPEISDEEDNPSKSYYQAQIDWLSEHFPEGVYNDVVGLCKVAKLNGEDGIIEQDYSLNPGRYVGVVIDDDGLSEDEFKEKMLDLHGEFQKLSIQAQELEKTIDLNLKELFGI